MKKIAITLSLLLLFSGCTVFNNNISGRILVKGQAPHTFIALKIRNRVYINVVGKLKHLLEASYQGKKVELRGKYLSQAHGVSEPARFEAYEIVRIIER